MVLAAAALGSVGILTLLVIVGPALGGVIGCDACGIDIGGTQGLMIATPFVSLMFAAGLLVRPQRLVRLGAIVSGVLALGWISPVLQRQALDGEGSSAAMVEVTALYLLAAAPFLLVTPDGNGIGRPARRAWFASIAVAVLLWILDDFGSRFMVVTTMGPQIGFLLLAGVIVAAGLISRALRRGETASTAG